MFRLLLLASLITLIATLVARWWFGIRILTSEGSRRCRCDLESWKPAPGDSAVVHRAEESANTFATQLRTKALASWLEDQPKAAKSRASAKRFGLAVPPLSGVVSILAIVVGKMPAGGVLTIMAAAIAVSSIIGLMSLPEELSAITRTAAKARKDRSFPNPDDEEAVIRCAIAQAWIDAVPPILKWLQKTPES